MQTNHCRAAACLLALAGLSLPLSSAHGVEVEVDEVVVHDVVVEDAEGRLVHAERRIAEAAKDLASAWKMRLHGEVPERAFLGVLIARQDEAGIHVGGLSPDGGAEKAGLLPEDVIVAVNGESLRGERRPLRTLQRVLGDVEPGTSVAVAVVRDGEELDFDVATTPAISAKWLDRLLERGDSEFEWIDRGRWFGDRRPPGLELVDIGEDLGAYFGVDAGVLVLDTPAASELKPGDILRRIAGAAVSSAEDAYELMRMLEAEAEAEVQRKNRKLTVMLAPPEAGWRGPGLRKRVIVVDPDAEDEDEAEAQ